MYNTILRVYDKVDQLSDAIKAVVTLIQRHYVNSTDSKSAVFRYWRNYVHLVLVNRLGWLVGCFAFNGPLRQYFSLYRAVSQKRERKRRERIDE